MTWVQVRVLRPLYRGRHGAPCRVPVFIVNLNVRHGSLSTGLYRYPAFGAVDRRFVAPSASE